MAEFSLNEEFVDIHGREIPIKRFGTKQEEACLLTDLKQTGVGIYQKSQYAKIPTVQKDFGPDFVDVMLEAAKTYMLNNKIAFTQDQIMDSIEHCKQCLTTNKQPIQQPIQSFISNNRKIETCSGEDIRIQVVNTNTSKSPHTPKTNSPLSRVHVNEQQPQRKFPKKGAFQNKSSPQAKDACVNGVLKREQSFNKFTDGKRPSKLRLPKRISYNISQAEHDVVVTAIDKSNCIWVRDVMNTELLEKIHRKVNEEAQYQRPSPKPWAMDKVYMAKDEGIWFRCRIYCYSPLTVFFLDYGNVAEVDQIRDVSEELAQTPCIAVRITFKENEYRPKLKDVIRIRSFMKNDDGTLFVNILKNSTNTATPMVDDSSFTSLGECSTSKQSHRSGESPVTKKNDTNVFNSQRDDSDSWDSPDEVPTSNQRVIVEEKAFFKKPPVLCKLENDQTVSICHIKNDVLYLRTRECFEKLRDIEDVIENHVKTAKGVQNVGNDQLVLCEGEDGKFNRAVVTEIQGNKVRIELLDYGECKTVAQTLLKSISEDLSKMPMTYFPAGRLAGFEAGLDDCQKRQIEEYAKKRKKFVVSLGFDDELDLYDGSQLLSEELHNMEKCPPKVMLRDMKTYKPEVGIKPYLCGFYKNSREVTFVPSDALERNMDLVTRSDVEDRVPYSPAAGEVCLCYYLGHWYRCVVIRIFERKYEVVLLDFGNVELINKEDLRKPDAKTTEIPALAIPCVLVGLPQHPNIENVLKELIIHAEIYNVDVKRISGGKCDVEVPTVYKQIRDSV